MEEEKYLDMSNEDMRELNLLRAAIRRGDSAAYLRAQAFWKKQMEKCEVDTGVSVAKQQQMCDGLSAWLVGLNKFLRIADSAIIRVSVLVDGLFPGDTPVGSEYVLWGTKSTEQRREYMCQLQPCWQPTGDTDTLKTNIMKTKKSGGSSCKKGAKTKKCKTTKKKC